MNQFSFEFPKTNHLGKSGGKTKANLEYVMLGFEQGSSGWG